ncbi:MAG: nitrilase-related carbon-nitrogen hydrolase [Planctomycetota bacterium]
MDTTISLEQTNPRLGDVATNLADHLERIERARKDGAGLVAFPELSLTGYFLKDQVVDLGMELDAAPLAQLAEASKGISIAVGFVERSDDGQLYNAYGLFEEGELRACHRKVHLVSYGLFDEGRDFAAGDRFVAWESRVGRIVPLICEDFWHVPSTYLYFLADVDLLLVASASPARGVAATYEGLGSVHTWNALLRAAALWSRTWVAYAGRVGWEDGIGFAGASAVFDPEGDLVEQLGGLAPGRLRVAIDRASLHRARISTPLRRDEKPWILARAMEAHDAKQRAEL